MGFFDKITKIAEKAADVVVKTSDKINETYQKEGFDGILNKTADSINHAGKKTQDYFNGIGEKNKQILDSIPENDLEGTLAKATAVVINTTQTIVKDAAKVTVDAVESVSKNLDKMVSEKETTTEAPVQKPVKKSVSDVKELFLNEGQIAELDCMPIKVYVKHLGAENNIDGQEDKYRIEGFTFITNNQKWYDFNSQKGGVGSLSFINHYIRVKNDLLDNVHPEVTQEIRNSTFDILSKILELKEYRDDLSVWIKEENEKLKKAPPKEEVVAPKAKRVRKTTPVVAEVQEEVKPVVKKVAKKTAKKLVVEPVEVTPAKKTTKKVVKAAVEETFSTPTSETKTRKPKV